MRKRAIDVAEVGVIAPVDSDRSIELVYLHGEPCIFLEFTAWHFYSSSIIAKITSLSGVFAGAGLNSSTDFQKIITETSGDRQEFFLDISWTVH